MICQSSLRKKMNEIKMAEEKIKRWKKKVLNEKKT